MKNLNNLLNIIKDSTNILILPHIMSDGDTLGSSVALCLALKEWGKHTRILLDEEISSSFHFFIPPNLISNHLEHGFSPDLVIAVDCSDIERLGSRKTFLSVCNSINIDHHRTNTKFAHENYVDCEAAATGEIIYRIIEEMGIRLSKDMATALYVAISTDTGSFKYDNTTPKTHIMTAELLEHEIDLNLVTTELYQNKPISKIRLMAYALNSLEFYYSGKLGILTITNKVIENIGAKNTDADGLIELVRDIEGTEVAILIREVDEGEFKVGFRSKFKIDVGAVAAKFGGGGHRKASGCTIFANAENTKQMIIDSMKNIFQVI